MTACNAPREMETGEEVRQHLRDIAKSEIEARRKRLASLTTEQQSAVEALLISVADLISHQVIDGIQSYPEAVRKKCVSVWCGSVVA